MQEFLQIVIGGLLQGCAYGLLAAGFALIYRVTATINLAQGAFSILAALIAFSVQQASGLAIGWAVLIAVAATAILSWLFGALLFVPGLKRLPASTMFILTAGLLTCLEGVVLVAWGSQPYTLPGFSGERPLDAGGILIPPQGIWLAGITAAVTVLLAILLMRTPTGRALRACAENPLAASLMGISVARMQVLSFVLAAVIGGIAGIVVGPITSFEFDTGRLYTIFGFVAAVIGGIGSPFGALVGGIVLGIATQLSAAYVSSLFSNALALLLLLGILLFKPSGLFGGDARRRDVREEPAVQRAIVRLHGGQRAAIWFSVALLALAVLPLVAGGGLLGSFVIALLMFLAVLGLDVLMGFTGQINLGQAGFMAIGGYVASILAVDCHAPPLLGTLAAMGAAVVCAAILAVATMRLQGLYLAIATLAFGLLVDSLATGLDGITGGPSGLVDIPSFSIGGIAVSSPVGNYYLVLAVILAVLALLTGAMRGGFGRALQAIRADAAAAAALGIRVQRYKVAAFCICAALGSLSGSLYAFYFHFLSPDMVGTPVSLQMLSMLVIGGEGTLFGPLLGVLLLTLLPVVFQPLAQYKTLGSGLLLILFCMYLPSGIFGLLASPRSGARGSLLARLVPARAGQ